MAGNPESVFTNEFTWKFKHIHTRIFNDRPERYFVISKDHRGFDAVFKTHQEAWDFLKENEGYEDHWKPV